MFKSVISWLDKYLLTFLVALLFLVVPLYPKIPLGELIEGYIVRLRLEDLLIFFTFIVWLIQLWRHKLKLPRHKLVKAIYAYLIIAFLSSLSAIFITHTVPLASIHLLKLAFHFFRRVEYFSLFFFAYSVINSKQDLILFFKLLIGAFIGVVVYGIGQKYFYLPAFSTMNREFSKGVLLYLQPNTRLFSTFGGHYDLGAYLIIVLGFILTFAWFSSKLSLKFFYSILVLFGVWSLVLTTSRTSFIGYLVGLTLLAVMSLRYQSWFWSFKRYFFTLFVSFVLMLFFSTLVERFAQVIPNRQLRTQINTLSMIINQPFVQQPSRTGNVAELPSLLGFLFKHEQPVIIPISEVPQDQLALVASQSDMPPTPTKPKTTEDTDIEKLPSDVTLESEAIRKQTLEDQGKTYQGPSYSPNALKYGLSMGIRLDELWPRAIAGFKRNPLLGTGYSTLVKRNVGEFTYAESTDNDYLRMLGETGLLGAIAFLSIIYFTFKIAYHNFTQLDQFTRYFGLGMMVAIISLLINALYIDVFESSKVAYTFWLLTAMNLKAYEV